MRRELASRVSLLYLLAVPSIRLCLVWRGGTGVIREQGLSRLTPVSSRGSVLDFGRLITSQHVISLSSDFCLCLCFFSPCLGYSLVLSVHGRRPVNGSWRIRIHIELTLTAPKCQYQSKGKIILD